MDKCDLNCDFCVGFSEGEEYLDRKIKVFRNEFILLSTLGCFREGYCLYMPVSHKRSFASLAESQLLTVESELVDLRQRIATEFSSFVILAEHGPGVNDSGASCCDHAHMHLIPVRDPRQVFLQFYKCSDNLQTLNNLSELSRFREDPYLYLSCANGQHLVWNNAKPFGRQFVRRVCADLDGLGPMFNWRIHPFHENMQRTAIRMRDQFERELIAV